MDAEKTYQAFIEWLANAPMTLPPSDDTIALIKARNKVGRVAVLGRKSVSAAVFARTNARLNRFCSKAGRRPPSRLRT